MMLMMLTASKVAPARACAMMLAREAAGGGTKRDGAARTHAHDAGQGGKGRRRDQGKKGGEGTRTLPCPPPSE